MKQYQLYVKLDDGVDRPWSYMDTYVGAPLVWQALLMARHRGCKAKVVSAPRVELDTDVVVDHA